MLADGRNRGRGVVARAVVGQRAGRGQGLLLEVVGVVEVGLAGRRGLERAELVLLEDGGFDVATGTGGELLPLRPPQTHLHVALPRVGRYFLCHHAFPLAAARPRHGRSIFIFSEARIPENSPDAPSMECRY